MIINNKLDHILTGTQRFVGCIFIITGVVFIIMDKILFGILILLLTIFLVTTFSGVEVNIEKLQIKEYNKLFGILKTGRWKDLNNYLGLTLVPMRKINTIASRANLTTSTIKKDFRIYLVNQAKRPTLPIKICESLEEAQNSIDEFSIWLKLPVYSIKR